MRAQPTWDQGPRTTDQGPFSATCKSVVRGPWSVVQPMPPQIPHVL